jgi:dihydropteroate synthase
VAHNVALLSRLEVFASLGCPIVVGASRKSFIGKILAAAGTQPEHGPKDRLAGSVAVAAWAAARGAGVLRVHDVAETVGAVRVIEAVQRK